MFVNAPNHHLNSADDEEDPAAGVAALDAEEEPSEELPPVVRAGDPLETPSVRDASLGGTRLAKVSKCQVSLQVQVLKEHE